jgi:hypothetical protein
VCRLGDESLGGVENTGRIFSFRASGGWCLRSNEIIVVVLILPGTRENNDATVIVQLRIVKHPLPTSRLWADKKVKVLCQQLLTSL